VYPIAESCPEHVGGLARRDVTSNQLVSLSEALDCTKRSGGLRVFLKELNEGAYMLREPNIICVQPGDKVTRRMPETHIARIAFPPVCGIPNYRGPVLSRNLCRVISRCIVDNDDFLNRKRLRLDRLQCFSKPLRA